MDIFQICEVSLIFHIIFGLCWVLGCGATARYSMTLEVLPIHCFLEIRKFQRISLQVESNSQHCQKCQNTKFWTFFKFRSQILDIFQIFDFPQTLEQGTTVITVQWKGLMRPPPTSLYLESPPESGRKPICRHQHF